MSTRSAPSSYAGIGDDTSSVVSLDSGRTESSLKTRSTTQSNGFKSRRQRARERASSTLGTSSSTVSAPVAYATRQSFPMKTGRVRSARHENSELIASVTGTGAFSRTSYSVNPGMATTFPWLSAEAVKWEQYRFTRLAFRYVTRTSTSTVGSIILSPDYNPSDNGPTSEVEATDTQDAAEDAAWKDITVELDISAMFPGNRKLVRNANVNGDLNLYDAANLHVCAVDFSSTAACGKLWVDYEVEFFVPQNSPSDYSYPKNTSVFGKTAAQTFTTSVAANVLWDAAATGFDPLNLTLATGVFTPPKGVYIFWYCSSYADSANEVFSGIIQFLKNGAALTPQALITFNQPGVAGQQMPVFNGAVVACNGTDTVSVSVTLYGAAGTLTSVANTPYLTVEMA